MIESSGHYDRGAGHFDSSGCEESLRFSVKSHFDSVKSHFDSVKSHFDSVLWSLRLRRGHFDMSLELLQAYNDSGGEDATGWDGDVPDDAHQWCIELHAIISTVYCDGRGTNEEPYWWAQNDDEFVEAEEKRRELAAGTLQPFLQLPYSHNVTMSEVTSHSGKKVTVVGYLFGTGEKLGDWDAFPLYFQKPDADGQLRSLQLGQTVRVGKYPFDEQVTVARILRGSKPAGTVASGKMQKCYFALVKYRGAFEYVSLQHLWYEAAYFKGPERDDDWLEDECHCGDQPARDQLQAAGFRAKSVSAVAKAAAVFISKLSGGEKKAKSAKPMQVPRKARKAAVTSTPHSKAAASDDESEWESSGESD
jgi:hypothetical protein